MCGCLPGYILKLADCRCGIACYECYLRLIVQNQKTCPKCGEGALYDKNGETNMRRLEALEKRLAPVPIQCSKCNERMTFETYHDTHYWKCAWGCPCLICEKEFSGEDEMWSHMMTDHIMTDHMTTEHPTNNVQTNEVWLQYEQGCQIYLVPEPNYILLMLYTQEKGIKIIFLVKTGTHPLLSATITCQHQTVTVDSSWIWDLHGMVLKDEYTNHRGVLAPELVDRDTDIRITFTKGENVD